MAEPREFKEFTNDPTTRIDDIGYLAYVLGYLGYVVGDVSLALSGALLSVASVAAPIIMAFSPAPDLAKIVTGVAGLGGTGGGIALARSHPKKPEEFIRTKHSSGDEVD